MESVNITPEYTFRVAITGDIDRLVELNENWQMNTMASALKSNGFLSAKFLRSDFIILIENTEVVVVETEAKVVGYYLLNNYCTTSKFSEAKNVISNLYAKDKIANGTRIGIGAQAVIDLAHQGKGLSRPMLKLLSEIVKSKYDYLYSSISKLNNKAFGVHTREGWFVVEEDEKSYYVLYKL